MKKLKYVKIRKEEKEKCVGGVPAKVLKISLNVWGKGRNTSRSMLAEGFFMCERKLAWNFQNYIQKKIEIPLGSFR